MRRARLVDVQAKRDFNGRLEYTTISPLQPTLEHTTKHPELHPRSMVSPVALGLVRVFTCVAVGPVVRKRGVAIDVYARLLDIHGTYA